jgi:hypothetical protein
VRCALGSEVVRLRCGRWRRWLAGLQRQTPVECGCAGCYLERKGQVHRSSREESLDLIPWVRVGWCGGEGGFYLFWVILSIGGWLWNLQPVSVGKTWRTPNQKED